MDLNPFLPLTVLSRIACDSEFSCLLSLSNFIFRITPKPAGFRMLSLEMEKSVLIHAVRGAPPFAVVQSCADFPWARTLCGQTEAPVQTDTHPNANNTATINRFRMAQTHTTSWK